MKKENDIYLVSAIILIIIFIILFFYLYFMIPIESEVFKVKFIVANMIGLELNNTDLAFGALFPGGTSIKRIFIDNGHNYPVKVRTYPSKEVVEFLSVEPETIIQANSNYSLPVQAIIPENTSLGNYYGELKVLIFRKSLF